MVRDVTREWEVDKLKTGIISVVSHEFRTPLTSVIGFSELLLMRDQDEEERRISLEHIHSEGLRLEALVNDFLDLSRLEAGRLGAHLESVDLAETVRRCLSGMRSREDGRPILVQVDSIPHVVADQHRLEQILTNLLSNAFKYSPRGSAVAVRARRAEASAIPDCDGLEGKAAWVIVTVEDQGLGIPSGEIPHLFTPFYRVDGPQTRTIRGTGLGLAIVKNLVEMHGGKVWVDSVAGEGSRFHVALRAADE